jgi:hypothetical protein
MISHMNNELKDVKMIMKWKTKYIIPSEQFYITIISLRLEICGQKTWLSPPLFTLVPLPSQESERSYTCVLGVSDFPVSTVFPFDF